jgi:hypothetical protein
MISFANFSNPLRQLLFQDYPGLGDYVPMNAEIGVRFLESVRRYYTAIIRCLLRVNGD